MTRIKIALVTLNDLSAGGGSGYESSRIRSLMRYAGSDFDIVIYSPQKLYALTKSQFSSSEVRKYRYGILDMLLSNLRLSIAGYRLLKAIGLRHGRFERSLTKESVVLVYFLSPNPLALDLVDLPMITTVWDLGHRDIPEFIEITGDRHFEERELYFQQTIPKSFRVIVDTIETSRKLQTFYGALPHRVLVGGLCVPQPELTSETSSEDTRYFLYPANFWPHKRHVLLLNAFQVVCQHDKDCKLVLTGSDKGNLEHVLSTVTRLGIGGRVVYRGFVDRPELEELVKKAHCLVFPSQLGPSNMPPLEAAMLGTQSLISNVHSDPLLVHPLIHTVQKQDTASWANEMIRTISSPKPTQRVLTNPDLFLEPTLVASIKEFADLRTEWSSSITKRFKRK